MKPFLMTGFDNKGIIHIKHAIYNTVLCGINSTTSSYSIKLSRFYIIYHSLMDCMCPKCWNKLDNKIVEKLKFDYIVYKLKDQK